jgi:pyruvate dehydrogenase E2 component (dihydrolipoamide acetyltransferase)
VEQGDPLLEVETDKVTMEVEAPTSGILARISAQAGDTVPVTAVIAQIVQPGELPTEQPADSPAHQHVPAEANAAREADQRGGVRATPVAQRFATASGIDVSQVPASAPDGTVRKEDVERFMAQGAGVQASPAPQSPARPRATPAARRVAREQGVDLTRISGSGPRGRIQAADVRGAGVRGANVRMEPAPARPLLLETPPLPQEAAEGSGSADRVEPLTGIRRTAATRLTQSYQTTPHIMLTVDVDVSAMERLRTELNQYADALGAPRVSVTVVLMKVCAWALRRHRLLNASWQDQATHFHSAINIGVAVALDDGLMVPVIRQVDRLGVGELAAQLHDLTERARQRRLTPDDVTGGTFTISNLGMFGIDHFTAIINPPEGAILAVGRMVKRLIVVEEGGEDQAAIRAMMSLTLSVDHRIIDGAAAARFLQDVVHAIERPGLLIW